MDWSCHCLVTLPIFSPSFSWDICFVTSWQWRQLLWKTHKRAGTVNTAHPDNYGFSPNDCNFQGDNANRQRRSGKVSMYDKLANISNHQWGDRRLINKMAEKKYIVEQGCQLTVATTQPERLGRLSVCFVRQIHFAPTEHNLKVGDCLSADRSFTSTGFILKMTFRLGLFTSARIL